MNRHLSRQHQLLLRRVREQRNDKVLERDDPNAKLCALCGRPRCHTAA